MHPFRGQRLRVLQRKRVPQDAWVLVVEHPVVGLMHLPEKWTDRVPTPGPPQVDGTGPTVSAGALLRMACACRQFLGDVEATGGLAAGLVSADVHHYSSSDAAALEPVGQASPERGARLGSRMGGRRSRGPVRDAAKKGRRV